MKAAASKSVDDFLMQKPEFNEVSVSDNNSSIMNTSSLTHHNGSPASDSFH